MKFFTFLLTGTIAAFYQLAPARPLEPRDWGRTLESEIAMIDARTPGKMGVQIRRLADKSQLSYHSDRLWNLATVERIPIAVALLKEVQSGEISLEQEVVLLPSYFNRGERKRSMLKPGTVVAVDALLHHMLAENDPIATELLIRLIGENELNRLIHKKMIHNGFSRISAESAERNNNATLEAVGALLDKLANKKLLNGDLTRDLLWQMERRPEKVEGIMIGLPPIVRFAQVTGERDGKLCSAGIMRSSRAPRDSVVIAVCLEGYEKKNQAMEALEMLGESISDSRVIPSPETD